jgi:hypothetical protein
MLNGHRSAGRRRGGNNRAARIAVPLAIPMALGLTLGIVLAVSGGNTTHVAESALGASASPSGSGSAPADPSATATATAPVAAAAANVNCDIIVPANPLSARGLATPYQLTGPNGMSPAASGCTMTNAAALGAFVQATILNPRTGALAVYNPLVITQGTTPAVAPVVPRLPRNAIVTIDFGFNGTDLTQVGATRNALRQGNCVNGLGSDFGQVSFCNGINFFQTALLMMRAGRVAVPAEGTSATLVPTAGATGTGNACPNVRNFDMIDQDQSDNVTTIYLLNPATGQTAQDTAANQANLAGSQKLVNGSDNALIDDFLDPTFGCTPFMAPDLGNNSTPATSQALDELLAARYQPRVAALVPENDEMTLDANGNLDPAKTNLYRAEVGQAPISAQNNKNDSPANYCQNMVDIQTPFLAANQALLATGATPVPAVGENLLTFMANRLNMSFTNLGCQNFGLTNPVTVVLDGNGAAMSATFNTTPQTATNTAAAGGGAGGGGGQGGRTGAGTQQSWQQIWQQWLGQHVRKGRPRHRLMDPSGM